MNKTYYILILIILSVVAGWWFFAKQLNKNMEPKKRILMVIAPVDFCDIEYFEPKKVFEAAGFEVKTASIQSGIARGADGGEAKIDLTVSQADPQEFDAVAFIGGSGMAQIVGDESLQVLALKFKNAGKLTTAICVAPAILARAGLLKDIQATSFPDVKGDLEQNGAIYSDKAVVVSGNIITANGPAAAKAFGEALAENLKTK
jgi:protease I